MTPISLPTSFETATSELATIETSLPTSRFCVTWVAQLMAIEWAISLAIDTVDVHVIPIDLATPFITATTEAQVMAIAFLLVALRIETVEEAVMLIALRKVAFAWTVTADMQVTATLFNAFLATLTDDVQVMDTDTVERDGPSPHEKVPNGFTPNAPFILYLRSLSISAGL